MANPWVRLWVDMPNDPKFRTIARVSKQSISSVIAVYVHMLCCASNAAERGRTLGWSDEDVASALDMDCADITAIRDAMEGRVLEGDALKGWDKRQPIKEDDAAARAKAWREAKKAEAERERTQANAQERPDTDTDKNLNTMSGQAPTYPDDAIVVLDYLNAKANRSYQPVKANVSLIAARLKEGATVDQCLAVIESKVLEWGADPKMAEYLRPATLFNATKFAQYSGGGQSNGHKPWEM